MEYTPEPATLQGMIIKQMVETNIRTSQQHHNGLEARITDLLASKPDVNAHEFIIEYCFNQASDHYETLETLYTFRHVKPTEFARKHGVKLGSVFLHKSGKPGAYTHEQSFANDPDWPAKLTGGPTYDRLMDALIIREYNFPGYHFYLTYETTKLQLQDLNSQGKYKGLFGDKKAEAYCLGKIIAKWQKDNLFMRETWRPLSSMPASPLAPTAYQRHYRDHSLDRPENWKLTPVVIHHHLNSSWPPNSGDGK